MKPKGQCHFLVSKRDSSIGLHNYFTPLNREISAVLVRHILFFHGNTYNPTRQMVIILMCTKSKRGTCKTGSIDLKEVPYEEYGSSKRIKSLASLISTFIGRVSTVWPFPSELRDHKCDIGLIHCWRLRQWSLRSVRHPTLQGAITWEKVKASREHDNIPHWGWDCLSNYFVWWHFCHHCWGWRGWHKKNPS